MNLALLGMLMDIIIVLLLMGTIYYAYTLSKQLKIFRESRSEFEQLLMQLTNQINTAHDAIESMQDAADSNGKTLNKLIRDGQLLADELQMVNEASDNLASRLERAASSARSETGEPRPVEEPLREERVSNATAPKEGFDFSIRDREVEDDDLDAIAFSDEGEEEVGDFHSQAERELFTALKRKR